MNRHNYLEICLVIATSSFFKLPIKKTGFPKIIFFLASFVITLVPAAHSLDVYAVDGQTLILRCNISQTQTGSDDIKWIHKNEKHNYQPVASYSIDGKEVTDSNDYQIINKNQVPTSRLFDLKIPTFNQNFTGEYRCQQDRGREWTYVNTVYDVKGIKLVLTWGSTIMTFNATVDAETVNTNLVAKFENVIGTNMVICTRSDLDHVKIVDGLYSCLKRNSGHGEFALFENYALTSANENSDYANKISVNTLVLTKPSLSRDCKTNHSHFFNNTHISITDLNDMTAANSICVMFIKYSVSAILPSAIKKPEHAHNLVIQRQVSDNNKTVKLLLKHGKNDNGSNTDISGLPAINAPALNLAGVVGLVVGIFLFLIIIVIVLCVMFRRRNKKDGDKTINIHVNYGDKSATAESRVHDDNNKNENDVHGKVNEKSAQARNSKLQLGDGRSTSKTLKESHNANSIKKTSSLPDGTHNHANMSTTPGNTHDHAKMASAPDNTHNHEHVTSNKDDTHSAQPTKHAGHDKQHMQPNKDGDSTKKPAELCSCKYFDFL